METLEETNFKAGDWVCIIDHKLTGCSGFIIQYDSLGDGYRMMVTKSYLGNSLSGKIFIKADQLVPIGIVNDEDDLLSMIDMALDRNDKEWFMELTEKLPLANF